MLPLSGPPLSLLPFVAHEVSQQESEQILSLHVRLCLMKVKPLAVVSLTVAANEVFASANSIISLHVHLSQHRCYALIHQTIDHTPRGVIET